MGEDESEDPAVSSVFLTPGYKEPEKLSEDDAPSKIIYTDEYIRGLEKKISLLEAQTELRDADLRHVYGNYRNALLELARVNDSLKEMASSRDFYKEESFAHLYAMMEAIGLHAEAESYLKAYERRFGSKEKLDELLQLEHEKCINPEGDAIDNILYVRRHGWPSRTFGERLATCIGRFTDTTIRMVGDIYRALTGRELEDENPKKRYPYMDECG